jgi:large conductance mechanosensitive channel
LITAFIVFIIIKTVNKLFAANKTEENEEVAAINEEVETLKEIRDLLKQK